LSYNLLISNGDPHPSVVKVFHPKHSTMRAALKVLL
jgi:hypothetical protein